MGISQILSGTIPAVGSTAGPPSSGAAILGQQYVDSNGVLWICSTSGSPGSWKISSRSNPYHALAYRSASLTSGVTTAAAIPFDTSYEDPNSNMNLSTGIYNCPFAGRYKVAGSTGSTSFNGRLFMSIYHNGVEFLRGDDITTATTAVIQVQVVGTVIGCAAGDTLSVVYYTSAAMSVDVGQIHTWGQFEYVGV